MTILKVGLALVLLLVGWGLLLRRRPDPRAEPVPSNEEVQAQAALLNWMTAELTELESEGRTMPLLHLACDEMGVLTLAIRPYHPSWGELCGAWQDRQASRSLARVRLRFHASPVVAVGGGHITDYLEFSRE